MYFDTYERALQRQSEMRRPAQAVRLLHSLDRIPARRLTAGPIDALAIILVPLAACRGMRLLAGSSQATRQALRGWK